MESGLVRISDHRAGIETTAQENAQRHFAHQPATHTIGEERVQFFQDLAGRAPRVITFFEIQSPIAAYGDPAVGVSERVRRRQLEDVAEHGLRFAHKALPEKRHNGLHVGDGELGRNGENRFDFGTEDKALALAGVEEWLLAQAIAGQEQTTSTEVPKGNPKHTAQGSQAIGALFFVQVRDDFRIRGSAKSVEARKELRAKIEVVVNLAVQNDLHLAILAGNRLMAAGHVNDTQAPDAQPDAIGSVKPFRIRATMHNHRRHTLEGAPDFRTRHAWIYYSKYSAHKSFCIGVVPMRLALEFARHFRARDDDRVHRTRQRRPAATMSGLRSVCFPLVLTVPNKSSPWNVTTTGTFHSVRQPFRLIHSERGRDQTSLWRDVRAIEKSL